MKTWRQNSVHVIKKNGSNMFSGINKWIFVFLFPQIPTMIDSISPNTWNKRHVMAASANWVKHLSKSC